MFLGKDDIAAPLSPIMLNREKAPFDGLLLTCQIKLPAVCVGGPWANHFVQAFADCSSDARKPFGIAVIFVPDFLLQSIAASKAAFASRCEHRVETE